MNSFSPMWLYILEPWPVLGKRIARIIKSPYIHEVLTFYVSNYFQRLPNSVDQKITMPSMWRGSLPRPITSIYRIPSSNWNPSNCFSVINFHHFAIFSNFLLLSPRNDNAEVNIYELGYISHAYQFSYGGKLHSRRRKRVGYKHRLANMGFISIIFSWR